MSSTEQPQPSVSPPSLEDATVADAMHQGVIFCELDTSPASVARTMALHHVHSVFVMHPRYSSGEPYVWGIISDLDLMRAVLRADASETAGSLASQPVVSVNPSMRLTDACALMSKHSVNHLAVVEPASLRPLGVLAATDVAEIFALR